MSRTTAPVRVMRASSGCPSSVESFARAVICRALRTARTPLEVGGIRRPVARGVGHAKFSGHRPDELRVPALVAVEPLFAGEGRHDGLRPLVAVRVLDAQDPEALGRVLPDAVLVRVGEGLDALAALEGV